MIILLLCGLTAIAWRYRDRQGAELFAALQAVSAAWASLVPVLSLMEIESVQDLPTRFEHGRQVYRADASEIRDWRGKQVGHAVVVRDISQLVTREQRLAVLNRILRHNVRNDMMIVMGVGEQLQARDNEQLVANGKTLCRTARD